MAGLQSFVALRRAWVPASTALQVAGAALIIWAAGALPASPAPRQVVLLFDERPALPGLAVLEAGLVGALNANAAGPVEVYREAMDLSRFGSHNYQTLLRDFLRAKYADKKIDVAVAVMGPALDFLLSHGDAIFPGAPIVFCGIDRRELGDRSLPPHAHGILLKREFKPTLDIALRLHPETKQAVVVAGTSEFDTKLLDLARNEFRSYEDRLAFTYLTALPLQDMLSQLSRLPPQTLVLFTTLFQDGAGDAFVPHDVVQRISAAASNPVYGFVDQYLGHGIVGGSLYSLDAHGPEAAKLALRVMAGTEAAGPPLSELQANKLMFDWRQLQRWGISADRLPSGSEIRFRPDSVWEQYQWHILLTGFALLGQSLLIAALLRQHRRRHVAELETRERDIELAHLNRRAVAGEISASIAHEINQPLGAILANAETAQQLLDRKDLDREMVRTIIADIIADDTRAAEVVARIRKLIGKRESRSEAVDVNQLVNATLRLLHGECVRRQTHIETAPAGDLPPISGDPVQLQQVLINVLINAMDAVAGKGRLERIIRVSTHANGNEIDIEVVDSGHGISPDHHERLFEPFFTTKEHGLGLGLSICATIVEAHRGRLRIENNDGGGAKVTLSFPKLTLVPARHFFPFPGERAREG